MNEELKEQVKQVIAESLAKVATERGEIVIREGKALEQKEPKNIEILGTIDAPARWVESKQGIDINQSHTTINRDKMSVCLIVNEKDPYRTQITGQLQLSQEIKKMHINDGTYGTPQQLAELIKMNRAYFENRTEAMKLVSDLMTFKARVNKQIETSDNNRGNKSLILQQAVESNLPETFTMNIPLFKGQPKVAIECEVYIRAEDLCCTIVSAHANEIVEDSKNELIDGIVERIKEALPGIAVIEI